MDFDYSEEQRLLFDLIDRFGAANYPAAGREPMLADLAVGDRRRWDELVDLGVLALAVPEHEGGMGGSATDVMAVMEAFGRHLIPEPYVSSCVLAPALLAGTGHGATLTAITDGSAIVAAALIEAESGFALDRIETRAEPASDGWRLTGAKTHVEDGGGADIFLVSAWTGDGIGLFRVPAGAPGLTVMRARSIDHHRHARLRLDGVTLGADAIVGEVGGALPRIEAAVDRAICGHLAEAVGSMDALVAMTLDYLKTRHQFGVAIGSFQALQHKIVDMAIAAEEARSMAYHATLHLDRPPAERRRAVAAGKARVGQCGLFVGRQAVQLHGGVGVTAELIVSHHLQRLMMIDLAHGDSAHHVRRFAEAA
ncbi:acyl-CoA dehydrogenase family protein [Sphingomonas sp.]|uniref:acyl-CoA dehydrogenase family protein n=1 Tax=Sphingomonas sp. TaxID=28214 RepID=UPI002DD646FB|nr:acyl-CoA dehydrogenase family protein [Sphingomonas sp.]